MDLIVIPHGLMLFYGGLVLGCGAVLGFIAARNVGRAPPPNAVEPDEGMRRRVEALEEEVEATRHELDAITAERDFMRELGRPREASPERAEPESSPSDPTGLEAPSTKGPGRSASIAA